MRKLNIDDVAKLAYVSRSVVSRVLNNRPNVSKEARARVQAVIKEYNYRPSATARSLATDRNYEISILAPRRKDDVFANGFWSLLFLGISEACIRRGYHVSLNMIAKEAEAEINDRILNGHSLDGYILIGEEVADRTLPALKQRNLPAALVGNAPSYPDLHSVDVDNVEGGYQATMHLLSLGHRRIAAIQGPLSTQEAVDRFEGFLRAHTEVGVEVDSSLCLEGDYSQQGGYDCMQRLLEQKPSAVMCSSDAQATGALLSAHRAGVSVPKDLSVIGYDDLPSARFTIPPLTTMRQPIYKMGERVAGIVLNQIEETGEDAVHDHLQAVLVERETTRAPS